MQCNLYSSPLDRFFLGVLNEISTASILSFLTLVTVYTDTPHENGSAWVKYSVIPNLLAHHKHLLLLFFSNWNRWLKLKNWNEIKIKVLCS